MDQERRRAIRIKRNFSAQYFDKGKNFWNTTTIRDISETGMCINTDCLFLQNEIIQLHIKFPFNPFQWVEFKGKVVEAKKFITRIAFIDITKEQLEQIKKCAELFMKK